MLCHRAESNTALLSNYMCTYYRLHLQEVLDEAKVIYTNGTENRGCMGEGQWGRVPKRFPRMMEEKIFCNEH